MIPTLLQRPASFVLLALMFHLAGREVTGQNPVCPPGVYFADPSARVWEDTLYLYGSTDEQCTHYCSHRHDLFSTRDMVQWDLEQEIFRSKGEGDAVPYNDRVLFAPDCIRRDGRYFLYYCQPDPDHAEGVAIADHPAGPFSIGAALDLAGHNQIDPAIFIDDDGTAWYLWGQFDLKMARLMPDGMGIDSTTLRTRVITEQEHYFHEGAFLTRRNGIYYLVYADISREDKPTCLGYSTAENPTGPYTYRGVIIDNDGCNPGNWNNHGSIAEFKGQWYVFYHRSTHGCKTMRKACVEKISFRDDGTIPEVEMTSQGAGPPLQAGEVIDAARACLLHGNVRITNHSDTSEILSGFRSGDAAIYKYIDFGGGASSVTIKIRTLEGGRLLLSAGKPWDQRLLDTELEPSKEWETLTFEITRPTGTHALWVHGYGGTGDLFEIDWFRFND